MRSARASKRKKRTSPRKSPRRSARPKAETKRGKSRRRRRLFFAKAPPARQTANSARTAETSMTADGSLKYPRLLVKLSGEALMGRNGFGIDNAVVDRLAAD